ncbi:hypothetical protein DXG01_014873, partial [Tephrocybe rancida]
MSSITNFIFGRTTPPIEMVDLEKGVHAGSATIPTNGDSSDNYRQTGRYQQPEIWHPLAEGQPTQAVLPLASSASATGTHSFGTMYAESRSWEKIAKTTRTRHTQTLAELEKSRADHQKAHDDYTTRVDDYERRLQKLEQERKEDDTRYRNEITEYRDEIKKLAAQNEIS